MTPQTLGEKEAEFLYESAPQFEAMTATDIWQLRAAIATAAYFRAERRGFEPGYELPDWLEAEKEIQSMRN